MSYLNEFRSEDILAWCEFNQEFKNKTEQIAFEKEHWKSHCNWSMPNLDRPKFCNNGARNDYIKSPNKLGLDKVCNYHIKHLFEELAYNDDFFEE